eukprot:TRINITY_DN1982_c0_g1_i6.p1 TRINITY_DN1982_c0_g1~~TRINITY_DN1982_c0_g1_i6.p1  ORF type:complete len:381 (-),score=119.60 TRINITY_DN1982_c0_g1_i6:20-1162(-)
MERRKIVVITARVHAAEVTGSFKVEGIISFLISSRPEAKRLRELYVFKVVPMLNPEGVLVGNHRSSLTGVDLNRRWDVPNETLHPQIYYLKQLFRLLESEKKEIFVFCDLHGHTRKNNSFVYGCNKAANGGFCSWTKVRLLPRVIATKTPMFSYNDCSFRVEGSKQRTARVVVWKEFKVTNSFTLESSFYGYLRGDQIAPYQTSDYHTLGHTLLHSLVEYYYVLKKLEKELVLTNGWLKPSRLLTVTGALAAEELAKKLKNEKKEERIKERLKRMNETSQQFRERRRRTYNKLLNGRKEVGSKSFYNSGEDYVGRGSRNGRKEAAREKFSAHSTIRNSHLTLHSSKLTIKNERRGSELSLIHICRCRRIERCRSRWSPYH